MPAASSPKTDAAQDACLCQRAVVLSAVLVGVFSLLGWRLVNLHVGQGDIFQEAARELAVRKVVVPAMRGAILDRNGELLALDRPSYSVVVDRNLLCDLNLAMRALARELGKKPSDIPRHFREDEMRAASIRRAVEQVAPRLKMAPKELQALIGSGTRGEVIVAKDLGDEEAQNLKDFLEEESIPGVEVRQGLKRHNPMADFAVHVVGFTNNENEGIEGVEKSLDHVLRGTPGAQWYERRRGGGEVPSLNHTPVEARPGRSIRLTLDSDTQRIVEDELDHVGDDPQQFYCPQLKAKRISVILMDPRTNSILALANRPQHSLVTRENLTSNAAIAETYEPGSTFKINSFVGVLDRKLAGLGTPLFLHNGSYSKGLIHIRDDHPVDGANVLKAFAQSSNIAAYKLAAQLGSQRYYEYGRLMGFGQRTGVELPNEATGAFRSPEHWGALSLRSLSFGYEVNVTPLQVLNSYCAIINDGVLRRPRLVEAILDDTGAVIEECPPVDRHRVCSSTAARSLRTAMQEVVKTGTGKIAAIPGFTVGGKTGTSQKYVPRLKAYARGAYVVSFVGYVASPAGPELAGVVVVDDPDVPKEKEYGSWIAAPIFRRIAIRFLEHRGIQPDPSLLGDGARNLSAAFGH